MLRIVSVLALFGCAVLAGLAGQQAEAARLERERADRILDDLARTRDEVFELRRELRVTDAELERAYRREHERRS